MKKSKAELETLVRDALSLHSRLYQNEHQVKIHNPNEKIFIGYRTKESNVDHKDTTHFDLQIENQTCFLLYIEVEPDERGKGKGWEIYQAVHEIASNLGCKQVQTTPSGKTKTGISREDWLKNKGYIHFNSTELIYKLS